MNPLVVVPVLMLTALTIIEVEQVRTDYEMCQEVAREVSLQAEVGLISQAEADRISERCFTIFAP